MELKNIKSEVKNSLEGHQQISSNKINELNDNWK